MKKIFTSVRFGNVYAVLLFTLFIGKNVFAQPANDSPCSALNIPFFNINISGNNTGATYVSEPARPACYDVAGTMNTVWYTFTAPPGGCVKIITYAGTLFDTQIGVFSGSCVGLVPVGGTNCSDNFTPCAGAGAFTYLTSYLQLSGLAVGSTYWIMIDGRNNNVGSFSIMLANTCAGVPLNPMPGQDCQLPFPVCSNSINVANPGYYSVGNICDFPAPTGCLGQGEKGTVWYQITINGPGNLEFDIIPNDYFGACNLAQTDYDFGIWKTAGVGATSCGALTGPNMIRCNYSAYGVTGCYNVGNAPAPYTPCFDGAYETAIPVVAGEIYLLCISNFDVTNSGFTLNIPLTSPIATGVAPGGTLIWTGTVSTDWFNIQNWGGCQIPDCDRNALIPAGRPFYPAINAAGAVCRTLDINLSASVTVNAGFQLQICQDFGNNGSFTAQNNSTVLFENTVNNNVNQNINGNVTGADQFWHVQVNKPTGFSVKTNQDVDMAGNFTINGAAPYGGTFDATFIYHKVGGNFNSQVGSTYLVPTWLEFYGSAQQTYFNSGAGGSLNSVKANNSTGTNGGIGAILINTSPFIVTQTLNLTSGTFRVGAGAPNPLVSVTNNASGAIVNHNASSFVDGTLRRSIANLVRGYDFPVGRNAIYENININFTVAPSASSNLTASFTLTALPGSQGSLECTYGYTNPYLNHGYWRITTGDYTRFPVGSLYDATAYNTGFSNTAGSNLWTVVKRIVSAGPGPWTLLGSPNCVNPVTAVQRTGMSQFGTSANTGADFAIAQGLNPLPVELTDFNAVEYSDKIILNWNTASEKENKGFELERTTNPSSGFEKISWHEGHGTTTSSNNYRFDDFTVQPNVTYYYRLKQIDYNGDYSHSQIVSGRIGKNDFAFSVLPNPYNGSTNIEYYLKDKSTIVIEVMNFMGQKISTLFYGEQSAGKYNYEFSAQKLGYAGGVYTVRVLVNNDVYIKHILETE
ncbi:MAG: hypothetical protein ACHQNT_00790 [Bacteroidia bacterium]